MRGRNLWWGSRIFSLLGDKRKRRIGRIRSITIPLRVGLKLLEPKLLIKIDQANLSCAIYSQLKDPLLSTSGNFFLYLSALSILLWCLISLVTSYLDIPQIIILQEFY